MGSRILANIFGIVGPVGMSLACMKYAHTRKDTFAGKLAYLVAFASLLPIARAIADLMEGASKLLIGITVVAIYLAVLTISDRVWEAKEDEKN